MRIALFLVFVPLVLALPDFEVSVWTNHVVLEKKGKSEVIVEATCFNNSRKFATVAIAASDFNIVNIKPLHILLEPTTINYTLNIEGTNAGHVEVEIISVDESIRVTNSQIFVDVYLYYSLYCVSTVLRWGYTILLVTAFYPQILLNFKRKSVVGLSFDFILFSAIEHVTYFMFFLGSKYLSDVQTEDVDDLLKFQPNTAFYNIHGIIVIGLVIIQCCLYEKDNQIVTTYAKIAFTLMILFGIFFTAWRGFKLAKWLNWLYFFLLVIISAFKFVPQILLNHKRKSTKGFSMALVNFKVIGSIFIFLQLFVDSINFDNWSFGFGNPVMIIVAVINISLSVFILIQFCLYNKTVVNVV